MLVSGWHLTLEDFTHTSGLLLPLEDWDDLVMWAACSLKGSYRWEPRSRAAGRALLWVLTLWPTQPPFAILPLKSVFSSHYTDVWLTRLLQKRTTSWLIYKWIILGSDLPLFLEVYEWGFLCFSWFACSVLGLPSQGSKKTLGQKLLGMLPSENSSKKTEDQDNPQEVFKMLTELVSVFAFSC